MLAGVGDQGGDLVAASAGAFEPAAADVGGGGGTGVRGFGRGPGGLPSSWGTQPVEAVEVVAEPLLGVVLGVAEDADRPAVAAVADGPQQLQVAASPGPAAGSSARRGRRPGPSR